jgi:hypothetical protein
MKVEEFEKRLKALEDQNKALQNHIRTLQDIEDIKRLQRAYGYYLEHAMYNEMADLWTDDGEMQWVGLGTFFGKEKIRKLWSVLPGQGTSALLHHAMQLSPIIDVAPDGKTAKGRWYAFGIGVMPSDEKLWSAASSGLYENEYVKQDGIWKIKVLQYGGIIGFDIKPHFIDPGRLISINDYIVNSTEHGREYPFDIRYDEPKGEYPSGHIRPFHYKHPVTGKETSVEAWNESRKKEKHEKPF